MTLDTKLALISAIVQAAVIGLLFFRKIYQKLPLFFIYLIWLLVVQAASIAISTLYPYQTLQRIFIIAEMIDAAFMICVLAELSMSVLSPIRSSLPRWTVFGVAGILAIAFALIWPFAKPPGFASINSLSQLEIHIDIAMSVLPIIFFIALAGCSQLLSLSWRDRELQIGTGLGIFALASLSVTLWKMNVGTATAEAIRTYHMLDLAEVGAYIVAMAYWLVSFAQKVPERREFTPQMESFLLALAGTARTTRVAMRDSSDFRKDKVRD